MQAAEAAAVLVKVQPQVVLLMVAAQAVVEMLTALVLMLTPVAVAAAQVIILEIPAVQVVPAW
jgi:hypothetical protein